MPELLLSRAGIAPERRGESLTVDEFATLARFLDEA
jgi:16S rRNA A1518/A1519 N6-dimethyltransferase RsmA/KsgA/DIM1 with predicted DNA glycosylase/AP lyase activity